MYGLSWNVNIRQNQKGNFTDGTDSPLNLPGKIICTPSGND